MPYNVLAVVGVWRSAARYQGDAGHAELARIATVIVMLLLSVRPELRTGRDATVDRLSSGAP